MSASLGLPEPYRAVGSASFVDFLAGVHPDRLPEPSVVTASVPHGTTIVAVRCAGGVVMAGDRRATMGNIIAQNDIEKVFAADDYSVVGIAGTAGIAVELVRLFQVELEHYEKIEGVRLSLEGKANRLSGMLRGNLGLAMQGLAVVPMLAGFDDALGAGRIFSYDVTGGRYEERDFYAVGSGSSFARGSLKKLYRQQAQPADAVMTALQALYDAADDDSATGGPDMARGIFPVVAIVSRGGVEFLDDTDLSTRVQEMLEQRTARPDGGAA